MGKVITRHFLKGTMVYDQKPNEVDTEKIAIDEIAEPATPEQEKLAHEAMLRRRARRRNVIYR